MTSASGNHIPVVGFAYVLLWFKQSIVLRHKVAVVDNFRWPILLGNDFLRGNIFKINFEKERVSFRFNGDKIILPFVLYDKMNNDEVNFLCSIQDDVLANHALDTVYHKLCLRNDVTLEPFTCHFVECVKPALQPDCSYI